LRRPGYTHRAPFWNASQHACFCCKRGRTHPETDGTPAVHQADVFQRLSEHDEGDGLAVARTDVRLSLIVVVLSALGEVLGRAGQVGETRVLVRCSIRKSGVSVEGV
jgi:hypothetical protein